MIVGSRLGGLGWRHIEQAAAEGELLLAVAAGEEAEVADAVEVFGQDMEQEAADELFGGEGQGLEAAVMAVVAPAEADLTVLDGEEAVVGDGDAVGVLAEVVEDLVGAGEGGLGVDDSLGLAEGLEVAGEGVGVVERGEGVAELEPAGAEGLLEQFEEEAAEQAGEDANGEEEAGAAGDPAVTVGSDAAAGDDAVQVRVQLKSLTPRMQHGEEADLGAKVFRV